MLYVVQHSIILDGNGFPYLSECFYYYLADQNELSLTYVSECDVGEDIKTIVEKVCPFTLKEFMTYKFALLL